MMLKKLTLTTAAALVAVVVSGGCSPAAESPGPRIIEVESAEYASSTIRVSENVVIRLPTQSGTGYIWRTTKKPSYDWIAMILKDQVEPADASMPGGPVEQVLTLRAIRPGIQAIDFEQVRPWDRETPPARQFTLNLTVFK